MHRRWIHRLNQVACIQNIFFSICFPVCMDLSKTRCNCKLHSQRTSISRCGEVNSGAQHEECYWWTHLSFCSPLENSTFAITCHKQMVTKGVKILLSTKHLLEKKRKGLYECCRQIKLERTTKAMGRNTVKPFVMLLIVIFNLITHKKIIIFMDYIM